MWNFQGSWFLALKFPRYLTILWHFQLGREGGAVLSGISRGKVKLKIPPVFKKVGLQPPLFVFSGRAQ